MTITGTICTAAAQVSATRLCSTLTSSSASSLKGKAKSRIISSGVRCGCAFNPQRTRESRRLVTLSLVFLQFVALPKDAMSTSILDKLDKYVKRKKLDPLEVYVPAVILTEMQIAELGKILDADTPNFVDCRNLLRSGPAASLRINIRAVAQYASDAGEGKTAFGEVDQCLSALEELDSLLLRASRNDREASIGPMKVRIDTALNALNGLLKTVPTDVLDKGKVIADSYLVPREDFAPENLDPQLKQLESLL